MTDKEIIDLCHKHGGLLGAKGKNNLKLCWYGCVGRNAMHDDLRARGIKSTKHGGRSLNVLREHAR